MAEEKKKSKEYQDIDALVDEIEILRGKNNQLIGELGELKNYLNAVTDKLFAPDCGMPSKVH